MCHKEKVAGPPRPLGLVELCGLGYGDAENSRDFEPSSLNVGEVSRRAQRPESR